jgi:LytR cell envelope-related transcriptional attenuator
MKHQWLAYVIVALLSIGAGVAIAGLPDNTSVDATIIPPTTTVAPSTSESATTVADTTVPETTEPATTSTTLAQASITTTTATTTTVAEGLPPRSDVTVIVANGANISGAAGRNVELLSELGYTDIAARNGTDIVEFTTVYYADGLEAAAVRLADDLDLLPEFTAPLADAPQVINLPEGVELVAYIGIDRAG